MIRTRTVFVLGAGTSADLGFPTGPGLLKDIRQRLEFEFDFGELKKGDRVLLDTLFDRTGERRNQCPEVERLVQAGRQLVAAAASARSIDNAIDTLEDEHVAAVGKIGIARAILEAEAKLAGNLTKMTAGVRLHDLERRSGAGANGFPVEFFEKLWLSPFAEILTSDLRRSQLDSVFANVSIINFNYDRTLELILPQLLARHFRIEVDEVRSAFGAMPYFRPYGRLGRLGWEQGDDAIVEFGQQQAASVAALSLQTFTEQVLNQGQLETMRSALRLAERIVFLGFGYHRQNLELLKHGHAGALTVLGTAVALREPSLVAAELADAFSLPDHPSAHPELVDLDCTRLLDQRARTLTS